MTDPKGGAAPAGGFQNGGWYSGYQYVNGTFAPQAGMIHPQSAQPGAGQMVSSEVNRQSDAAQGKAPGTIDNYVAKQNSTPNSGGGGGSPGSTGGGGGTGAGSLGVGGAPTFDLVAATNAAYNTPEIAAAQKAITDRQAALATASANINDNPFYSEATRVGKQAQLTTEANNDIGVQQGILTNLKADAAVKLNAQQGQYNINHQAYQDNLTNFNNLVSSGALDNASASDIANLAVQTGIPTSMIQSIATNSRNKDNPTQIVQATVGSDLQLLAVDKNGKVVNTTTIPGAGAKSSVAAVKPGSTEAESSIISTISPAIVSSLNSYGNISPQDWQKALAAWLSQGLPTQDFIKNFGQYADTNRGDFQQAYGFTKPKAAQ